MSPPKTAGSTAAKSDHAIHSVAPRVETPVDPEFFYKKWVVVTASLAFSTLIFIRVWQGMWWFPEGLDASTWEFARYWLSLLYAEWAVVAVSGITMLLAYRNSCPVCDSQRQALGRLTPEHELRHIGKLWAIITVAAVFAIGVSYFGEQDAAWHQVVVRDTTFTPSHIPTFFYTFPMLVVMTMHTSWYCFRRLHHLFVKEGETGLPISYFLFPCAALIMTANVAFNELGHSTWITEELFVQPFHFPFAWATFFFFTAVAILAPTIPRLFENVAAIQQATDAETAARASARG